MSVDNPAYPIRAASRLTGISLDTLRAWERRYQAVVPERGERGRVYREAHIARLRRLDALVRGGHAIGSIAALTDRELGKLIDRGRQHHPNGAEQASVDLTALTTSLERVDLPALDSTRLLARAALRRAIQ